MLPELFRGPKTKESADLNTRGTSPDNNAALSLDVDALLGPERRVVNYASERFKALEVGNIAFGGEPGSNDNVFGFCCTAISCLHGPFTFGLAELGINHYTFESIVFFDFKNFVDVIKVVSEFLIIGIIRRPCPVFVDFRDGILVPEGIYMSVKLHT
jgi:hypothetical protein